MSTAKVTTKGQITIPKGIRDALGLQPGDRIAFHLLEGGRVELQPRTVDLVSLAGSVRTEVRGVTLDDKEAAIADGAAEGLL